MPDGGEARSIRAEPAFNAPWPIIALIVVLVGAHAARTWLGIDADRFALTAEDLRAGRWGGLITHIFVHGGWPHVLLNSVFILAFGTPVARFLR
ncbi:MAG TPA: rhomboid family intramembrane serine protease, partial [Caulobacteraceae bacterium]